MKAKQPHTAIVFLKIEVHPNLDTGECSGYALTPAELKEAGIEPMQVIEVKGFDRFECLKKLKQKLEEFKK